MTCEARGKRRVGLKKVRRPECAQPQVQMGAAGQKVPVTEKGEAGRGAGFRRLSAGPESDKGK